MRDRSLQSQSTAFFAVPLIAVLGLLLVAGPASASFPGRNGRIAFVVKGDVFTVDAKGKKKKRESRGASADLPRWSPFGGKVVYADHGPIMGAALYVNRISNRAKKGKGITKVKPGIFDRSPSWNKKGTRIVFSRIEVDASSRSSIYVINGKKLKVRPLLKDEFDNSNPFWSPDGKKIAFVSDRNGNSEIYVMTSKGKSLRRVTNDPGTDVSPSWSPDSKKIVFTSDRDGVKHIYTVKLDGSSLKRVTNTSDPDATPTWSPDGKKIAFARTRDGKSDIYTVLVSGKGTKRLTKTKSKSEIQPDWARKKRSKVKDPSLF